jgi:hypothetical protein
MTSILIQRTRRITLERSWHFSYSSKLLRPLAQQMNTFFIKGWRVNSSPLMQLVHARSTVSRGEKQLSELALFARSIHEPKKLVELAESPQHTQPKRDTFHV